MYVGKNGQKCGFMVTSGAIKYYSSNMYVNLLPKSFFNVVIFNISNALNTQVHWLNGPLREKTCLLWFGNNKGADQPEHPRSLISTFVIRFLESIISTSYKQNFHFTS